MLIFLLAACSDGVGVLGRGDEVDAYFSATALTWACGVGGASDTSATSAGSASFDGVWSFDLGLAYAPDAWQDVGMPTDGACVEGLELFTDSAGDAGHDLQDADAPGWFNGDVSSDLPHVSTGWYLDHVIEDQQACSDADALFGDDIQLTGAGTFTGASTPSPGALERVTVTGTDDDDEVNFGADMTVAVDATGWDRTFLYVRRESGGSLLESVTCDTTGVDNLTIGSTIWDAFSTVVKADGTMLYVGFQNSDEFETKDGQRIAVDTRVMRSVVVK